MDVDLSAANLIRAGSGILFFLLGALVLAKYWGRGTQPRLIGLFSASFGLGFFLINIFRRDPTLAPIAIVLVGLSYFVFIPTAIALAFKFPVPIRPRERRLLFLSLAIGFLLALQALVLYVVRQPPEGPLIAQLPETARMIAARLVPLPMINTAALCVLFVLLPLRVARLDASAVAEARRAAIFYAAASTYPAFITGGDSIDSSAIPYFQVVAWPVLATIVASAFLWIYAAHKGPIPSASRNVALWSLLFVVAGALATAVEGGEARALTTATVGVVRTIAWTVLAYGLLRGGILGFQPSLTMRRRGAIATATLAAFFIVAQVVQNFLSAELGLLTGSVAAGAFLFAAAPIQRIAEKLLSRSSAEGSQGAPRVDAEAAYHDAVLLALNDGEMNAVEERYLAKLAQDLGLKPMDALEIKDRARLELAELGVGRRATRRRS